MCNFGGSSTNNNSMIMGRRDPNRRKLRRESNFLQNESGPIQGYGAVQDAVLSQGNEKAKSMTKSDNYKG